MALISIDKVECKDCYKCVRFCPVKAIRVIDGRAEVVEERCIGDGSCVVICPQKAKTIRSDIDKVRTLLASGRKVIASIAPSAKGIFYKDIYKIIGALKRSGFDRVEETCVTAEAVALEHLSCAGHEKPVISTACPAVVSLVEKYYPEHVEHLAPVVSPMAAHARELRAVHGDDTAIVFIGPCVAKKNEAPDFGIDAVLTFDELRKFIAEEIDETGSTESGFDNEPAGKGELFPIVNGLIKSAGIEDDSFDPTVISVSGVPDIMDTLEELNGLKNIRIIEALACKGGCLMGAGAAQGPDLWERRNNLLELASMEGKGVFPADLGRSFDSPPLELPLPSEEEIVAILKLTGKTKPEDEHNCGACGYNTCREKAIAVFQGMAEAEMCIPYMRFRAESLANEIVRTTPSTISIVDSDFRFLSINPSFEKIFNLKMDDIAGRPIEPFLDPNSYKRVLRTGKHFTNHNIEHDGATLSELVFLIPGEEILVGIYVDVTDRVDHEKKIATVKKETLEKAEIVIENQMKVAHEIAGLLGETTADTKVLLTRLKNLFDDETAKD